MAVSSTAWGDVQAMFGGDLIEQDYAQIVFGDPGQLFIDGSDHKTILPLPMATRVFSTLEDYQEFLRDTFNVAMADGDGWTIVRAGSFYSYDSSLQTLFQVSDPLLTLIGGRYGMITVDGVDYCVDGDRCADPVHYLSLRPIDETIESEGAPASGLQVQAESTTAASSTFSIRGFLRYAKWTEPSNIPDYGPYYGSTSTAITQQVSGGFQILRVMQVGGHIQCWSYMVGGEGCYFVPVEKVILETSGSNTLSVLLRGYAKQRRLQESCKVHLSFLPVGGSLYDTPSVTVEYSSKAHAHQLRANDRRAKVHPTYLEGEHSGSNANSYGTPTRRARLYSILQTNPPEC